MGLTAPTAVAWTPDGTMLVAEQAGRVRVSPPEPTLEERSDPEVLLDISDHVNSCAHRGFTGLAVDKDFSESRHLYLLYTYDSDAVDDCGGKVARLTRVTVNDDYTGTSSETTVLGTVEPVRVPLEESFWESCPEPSDTNTSDCIPADTGSYSVGTVRSDPQDGTLWVTNGTGALSHDQSVESYNEQSHRGKVLHVDSDGRGLEGHPFCPSDTDLSHVCTKVYAMGFRQPFRLKLRPSSGPVLGDVGESFWEEIDLLVPGRNYGWPCYEGPKHHWRMDRTDPPPPPALAATCPALYDLEGQEDPLAAVGPDYTYRHRGLASVVAGPTYVCTDPDPDPSIDHYPCEPGGPGGDFTGDIFFGDTMQGFIKRLELDAQGQVSGEPREFASGLGGDIGSYGVVDLEPAANGNLAYVDYRGRVVEIVYGSIPPRDTDSDGCTDSAELHNDPADGGDRDPTYFWDFMDVPAGSPPARSGWVGGPDIAATVLRFGSNDAGAGDFDRSSDPLSTPNLAVLPANARANYHPAYDRSGAAPENPLRQGQPNGNIVGPDIAAVVLQFGHSCIS